MSSDTWSVLWMTGVAEAGEGPRAPPREEVERGPTGKELKEVWRSHSV